MNGKTVKLASVFYLLSILFTVSCMEQDKAVEMTSANNTELDNKQERLEWLKDAGLGMFIHWSMDSQLGIVISHSLRGASSDYAYRYFNELPNTFNPKKYDPEEWAVLAKLAGMKYMVFTTKHHSGFCMWDTKTTDFNIMNTPYGKDIVGEYVQACRKHGLQVGFYFSPEDFSFLHRNGNVISRRTPEANSVNNEHFVEYNKAQLRELMTQYGKIDVIFFDGKGSSPLTELCWQINPDILVTRGAIRTPEQALLGTINDQPWEACVTMGTQWQYKASETYKSATRLIEILIETRAKGGALLLNVGPKPDGELPVEQEERLREMALWYFINQEAIDGIRPWIIPNEDNIWYTMKDNVLYAFITRLGVWDLHERKSFLFKSVKGNDNTIVEVLGQSDENLARMGRSVDYDSKWTQEEDGVHVSVVRACRTHQDHKYYNPVVIKITNVEPALTPPVFSAMDVDGSSSGEAILHGQLDDIGDAEFVEAGFQYRISPGFGNHLYFDEWTDTKLIKISQAGDFSVQVTGLKKGKIYQYRAIVKHPLITFYGNIKRFMAK